MFTHSISAKTPQRPKNRRLSPLLANFGKIVAASSQAILNKPFFYFIALIFFTLTLASIFVSASFLPKISKVKERGWKFSFGLRKWEKLAGVSTTITSVAVTTAFRVLYWWKQQCNQISNGCLEKFQKKLAS
jgi:hypothetical protein